MKVYKSTSPTDIDQWSWCTEQFGPEGIPKPSDSLAIVAGLRWWRRQGHLFFRSEKDYVLYCLRWA